MLHAGQHPAPPMTRDQSLVGRRCSKLSRHSRQGRASSFQLLPCLVLSACLPLSLLSGPPTQPLERIMRALGCLLPRTHSHTRTHTLTHTHTTHTHTHCLSHTTNSSISHTQRGDQDRTGSTGDRPRDVTLPSEFQSVVSASYRLPQFFLRHPSTPIFRHPAPDFPAASRRPVAAGPSLLCLSRMHNLAYACKRRPDKKSTCQAAFLTAPASPVTSQSHTRVLTPVPPA